MSSIEFEMESVMDYLFEVADNLESISEIYEVEVEESHGLLLKTRN